MSTIVAVARGAIIRMLRGAGKEAQDDDNVPYTRRHLASPNI
jgi:hypothetical protein